MAKARKPKPGNKCRASDAEDATAPPAVQEPVATYATSAPAARSRLSAELAPHAAELKRMLAFIDLAKGFALAFAECNFQPLRKSLIEAVRQRCEPSLARIAVIDLSDAEDMATPLDAIASRVPADEANGDAAKRVLMIFGLEAHVHVTDPQPAVLAALNMARDAFPSRIPEPMVFWLPDYLLTTLSRVAPDFWAWANATFRFRAPQRILASALQQVFGAQEAILDANADDARARIRTLEGLLQEYHPSIGRPAPSPTPRVLEILNQLGAGYLGLGQVRTALDYWKRMLVLAREVRNRQAEADALVGHGITYGESGEMRKAMEFYGSALAVARENRDPFAEALALGNLGRAYVEVGDLPKAVEAFGQHLTIARETGDRRGEGQDLGNLGNAYFYMGQTEKAIQYYQEYLNVAREVRDRRGEGAALGNLGNAYFGLGQNAKAIEFVEQQLKIAREIGDRRSEGQALGNLGNAYAALGELRKAIEHYEQALKIAREIENRWGEGNAIGNLGLAYASVGEPRKAIEFYKQALEIAREIGDRRGEATASWNLGLAYERQGDLRRAVELMQVRVDYERELGHADAEKHAAYVEGLRKKMGK